MKFLVLFSIIISISANAFAIELVFFNPNVFGSNVNEAVTPLEVPQQGAVMPAGVYLDTNKSKYYAARVYYHGLSFAEVFDKFTAKYGAAAMPPKQNKFAVWRIEKQKFAIQLNGNDPETVEAIYIQFLPNKEVFEAVQKLTTQ